MSTPIFMNEKSLSAPPVVPILRIGLIGFGTVGSGVWEVLQRNADTITRRCGAQLRITHVADRDVAKVEAVVQGCAQVMSDALTLAKEAPVDVLIELMGGTTVAEQVVRTALAAGKHVVTANKALLATQGTALYEQARQAGRLLVCEAAVAGGIPIIKILREGLAANQIHTMAGIINGTTNFILSQMRTQGWNFQTALQEAQKLGYAEADPTFDIEGIDAAHKITLLASMAWGLPIDLSRTSVEGISALTPEDIAASEELGYRIKLLGIARRSRLGVEVRVHPTLVPHACLLAQVEGAMNAVWVQSDALGDSLYYGKGAGSEPTASAVVADLIDLARLLPLGDAAYRHAVPALGFQAQSLEKLPAVPTEDILTGAYLRLRVKHETGVLNQVTALFAQAGVGVDALLQKESPQTDTTDLMLLTHETPQGVLTRTVGALQALPCVLAPVVFIRKEHF
jgi:homoserine dehydrogenase